jgi:hypothetical protein
MAPPEFRVNVPEEPELNVEFPKSTIAPFATEKFTALENVPPEVNVWVVEPVKLMAFAVEVPVSVIVPLVKLKFPLTFSIPFPPAVAPLKSNVPPLMVTFPVTFMV